MRHYAPVVMVCQILLGCTGVVPAWAAGGPDPQRISNAKVVAPPWSGGR